MSTLKERFHFIQAHAWFAGWRHARCFLGVGRLKKYHAPSTICSGTVQNATISVPASLCICRRGVAFKRRYGSSLPFAESAFENSAFWKRLHYFLIALSKLMLVFYISCEHARYAEMSWIRLELLLYKEEKNRVHQTGWNIAANVR